MKLAKIWYDDPDGQHRRAYDNADDAFRKGILSGAECGYVKREANKCRAYAKAVNAAKVGECE